VTIAKVLTKLVTLPYYHLFRQVTLLLVESIGKSVQDGDNPEIIAKKLRAWRERKSSEFQIVQVAMSFCTAMPLSVNPLS
jgi:hypothetical protein